MDRESTERVEQHILQNRLFVALLLLVFCAVVLRNAWLNDDALITLRTVRNVNEGYGLVWNIHERVQAYTHPLWMLLLSLTYFIAQETYFSTIAVSIILSIFAATFVSFKVAQTPISGLLVLLLLTLSKAFVDYTTSGLENPLSYLLLALFFYLYIRHQSSAQNEHRTANRQIFWLVFVASLGVTNRMDTALIYAPALLHTMYGLWNRGAITSLFFGGAPVWGWTLFSIIYYGFPFPNTAYAKLSGEMSTWEKYLQGISYLFNSLSVDPITLIVIGLAATYAVIGSNSRLRFIMAGVLLYIAYVTHIGGDFMSGRFFGVPYLGAVLVLSQLRGLALNHVPTIMLFIALIICGLLNPKQSPLLSNAEYHFDTLGYSGVADERGHYYPSYGLFSTNRNNRLDEQGFLRGTEFPEDFPHCGIGHRGFVASPQTRLIDECGLADAFIARLPPKDAPDWRVGHPLRAIPRGYFGTLRTGTNQFHDPDLAVLYDKLAVITQGDIWSRERFAEIWHFNTGAYAHLIDPERVRFPDIVELTVAASDDQSSAQRDLIDAQLFFGDDFEIAVNVHGVRVQLADVHHVTHLDVGLTSGYFEVVYFLAESEIARQIIRDAPLQLAAQQYSIVTVPASVTEQGVDTIRISPRLADDHLFTYINLLNLSASDGQTTAFSSAMELQEALHLYYYFYYRETYSRAQRTQRNIVLPYLLARMQQTDPQQWESIPASILYTLIKMPDPPLHEAIFPHLPQNILLVDAAGTPQLRYLGAENLGTIHGEETSHLQLGLHFLVEGPINEPYTLWFGIKQHEKDLEWMIYDYEPPVATTKWEQGTVVSFDASIEMEPDLYEMTFGWWTQDRHRLTTEDPDVYWIDLGTQEVEDEDG